ncbi:glycoside hydrolase family 30 beta sandwich domain-containing protein [Paenibacillus sp. FSL K6-0276]|uniref:glycoside hydrolase family 30 protein n=1 Tax=Paenibacillus sp. FSL K6-0276 TaxID=2921450 RepID=UPI0030EF7EB1
MNTAAVSTAGPVSVWLSSEEEPGQTSWFGGPQEIAYRLSRQRDLLWTEPKSGEMATITITPEHTGQTILGLGTSLEETTVHNLARLSPERRREILTRLADASEGIGLNLFRITLGSADFTAEPFYSYDDMPEGGTDFEFEHFSIQKDIDLSIVDTVKLLLSINPEALLFASPWSPPGWMKTSGSLIRGSLKEGKRYTAALARYYRLALQAYREAGIPIFAMTLQNEPLLETGYPSCHMTPERQKELAIALRRELDEHGIDTRIWIFDHNFSDAWDYTLPILNDGAGYASAEGIALHDYEGEPEVMSALRAAYPDKPLYLTERSLWGTRGADRMAQYFRFGASSYNAWVTMLDSDIAPHQWTDIPGPTLFIRDAAGSDRYWVTPEYYLLGQYSRFIRRGAVRIASGGGMNSVNPVVFRNPDGGYVALVVNCTDRDQDFRLLCEGRQFTASLPAGTVGTYCWVAVLD